MVLWCLSWIRELVVGKEDEEEAPFPDDVSAEILLRLPADDIVKCRTLFKQWDRLTSTPHFIQLHLQRATPTPTLFVQYHFSGDLFTKPGSREFIYCKDDSDKNKSNDFFDTSSKSLQKLSSYYPWLRGSCNGLLLFESSHKPKVTKFFVINPVTEEYVSVSTPLLKTGHVCSIYFHPTTRDYNVLYYYLHQHRHQDHNTHSGCCYRYFTYALWAKTWKEITPCFSHRPTTGFTSNVLVNGNFHWIAEQDSKNYSSYFSRCKHAIMLYSIDTEEFRSYPHPGQKCENRDSHQWMYLFKMKGKVTFCQLCYIRSAAVIYVWVLEDYYNWGWAYRYKVDLGWMNKYRALPGFYDLSNRIKLLNILNGELIFDWNSAGMYCCKLKDKRVWQIGKKIEGIFWWSKRYGMAVTYSQSLVRPSL